MQGGFFVNMLGFLLFLIVVGVILYAAFPEQMKPKVDPWLDKIKKFFQR